MGKRPDLKSLNIDIATHKAIKREAVERDVDMMDLVREAWEAFAHAGATENAKIVEFSGTISESSDKLSDEAIQWAKLAEIARGIQRETGREMYLSVFLQLRMVARDALRENGRDAEIPELPQHPADAPETKRTGRTRGGAAAPVVRSRTGKG